MLAVPLLTHLAFFQDDMEAYRTQNRFLNSEIHQVTKIWRKVAEKEKALLTKVPGRWPHPCSSTPCPLPPHLRFPNLSGLSRLWQLCRRQTWHTGRSGGSVQNPCSIGDKTQKFSVRGKRWTGRDQKGRKANGSPEGWIESARQHMQVVPGQDGSVCSFSPEAKMKIELAQQSCQNSTVSVSQRQKARPRAHRTHPNPADLFTEVEIGVGVQGNTSG